MSTTIQGRRALVDKLGKLPPAARKRIRTALEQSAKEMTALVRAGAPVDTGRLRDSVGYAFGAYEENRKSRSRIAGTSAEGMADPDLTVQVHAGGGAAFYARFVEFGTRKPSRPARPFFYPAFRLARKKLMRRITVATNKAAREVAKGGGG